jgi:hypothetical protein
MKPIQVVIEYLHVGTNTCVVRNVWDFVYDMPSRTLYLTAYRKYYQYEDGKWESDMKILPAPGDSYIIRSSKLTIALGEQYDKHKVLTIAKAKCLEQDYYMKYNEIDCIEVKWYNYE